MDTVTCHELAGGLVSFPDVEESCPTCKGLGRGPFVKGYCQTCYGSARVQRGMTEQEERAYLMFRVLQLARKVEVLENQGGRDRGTGR